MKKRTAIFIFTPLIIILCLALASQIDEKLDPELAEWIKETEERKLEKDAFYYTLGFNSASYLGPLTEGKKAYEAHLNNDNSLLIKAQPEKYDGLMGRIGDDCKNFLSSCNATELTLHLSEFDTDITRYLELLSIGNIRNQFSYKSKILLQDQIEIFVPSQLASFRFFSLHLNNALIIDDLYKHIQLLQLRLATVDDTLFHIAYAYDLNNSLKLLTRIKSLNKSTDNQKHELLAIQNTSIRGDVQNLFYDQYLSLTDIWLGNEVSGDETNFWFLLLMRAGFKPNLILNEQKKHRLLDINLSELPMNEFAIKAVNHEEIKKQEIEYYREQIPNIRNIIGNRLKSFNLPRFQRASIIAFYKNNNLYIELLNSIDFSQDEINPKLVKNLYYPDKTGYWSKDKLNICFETPKIKHSNDELCIRVKF